MSAVLTRHAAAVLARSPSAFLADLDTAEAAGDFRTRQQAQITNIAQVPLQSWRYSLSAPVTEPAAGTAAAKRLGAPALIVRVSLAYALKVVDAQPSVHDLWWTFTQRHGQVYLAGDSDLAELGGASWRGPWDYGPLVVVRGASSLVLGHPQAASQLAPLAAIVDAAVPVVSAVWGQGWSRQVAVLVPASDAELSALAGAGSALTDVSAVTVSDAPDPVNGTRSGQRLVLNPSALSTLTAAGLRVVVQHELTHIASASATGQASPRWLVEGLAEYVANLGNPQPVSVAASELREEVAGGTLPAALPGDAEFAPGAARLPQVYEEAWLACRLIAARAGQDGLVKVYRLVGASPDVGASALSAALRTVLHLTPAAFTAQWRSYLVGTLG
ncbi:MAG: hypothetical protein ABI808_06195 [Pseudonocardiales bacterium]